MTSSALLRVFGYLYAAFGILAALVVFADAYAGYAGGPMAYRTAVGIALLVTPFVVFSFMLFGYARNPTGSMVGVTFVLSLLAILYFFVNRTYGFYSWYVTGNSEILDVWAFQPIVGVELVVCLALGAALWLRNSVVWLIALVLAAGKLLDDVSLLPLAVALYSPVQFGWPDLAIHIFPIAWLLVFVVLVVAQLMNGKGRQVDPEAS